MRLGRAIHHGEKGFTLIELLIVVAILGILAAVIIPNVSSFMKTGTLNAANTEEANVKTASMAFYADWGVWPYSTANMSGATPSNPGNEVYTTGTLKAAYFFNSDGTLSGVGNPGASATGYGATGSSSSGYSGITFNAGTQQWTK